MQELQEYDVYAEYLEKCEPPERWVIATRWALLLGCASFGASLVYWLA